MARALIRLVRIYQRYISSWTRPRCRFYPSCSSYAMEALRRYGALRGGWMSLKRLARCQPFCKGGYDPVV